MRSAQAYLARHLHITPPVYNDARLRENVGNHPSNSNPANPVLRNAISSRILSVSAQLAAQVGTQRQASSIGPSARPTAAVQASGTLFEKSIFKRIF